MEKESKKADDEWGRRALLGRTVVRGSWLRLRPETRSALTAPDDWGQRHYDERGRSQKTDENFGDIAKIEYALGTLYEASKAKVPRTGKDEIPQVLAGDDVLNQAAELLFAPAGRDPEFAALAVHAVTKQQISGALSLLYSVGGSVDGPKHVRLRVLGHFLGALVFGLGLFPAIGYGLAFAFQGDGASATFCAFFGFIAVSFFLNAKEKNVEPELVAYRHWSSMAHSNFQTGTGHGLLVKLTEMARQGVNVPSVLFDLCAMLHRR